MMSQREAVEQAVSSTVEINGRVLNYITPEQLKTVHAKVVRLFLDGLVELKGERTEAWIIGYVPGLCNNWLRKAKTLNGNVDYVAKHPGSRTGAGDETMKAMKQLLLVTTDATQRSEIQMCIDERTAELAAAKLKPINTDALPEALKRLVPVSTAVAPIIRKAE